MVVQFAVFIATSLDGFIARPDGGIDWLDPFHGEDHGYGPFFAGVDALVIGRGTTTRSSASPSGRTAASGSSSVPVARPNRATARSCGQAHRARWPSDSIARASGASTSTAARSSARFCATGWWTS
jgi:hypothetical protein